MSFFDNHPTDADGWFTLAEGELGDPFHDGNSPVGSPPPVPTTPPFDEWPEFAPAVPEPPVAIVSPPRFDSVPPPPPVYPRPRYHQKPGTSSSSWMFKKIGNEAEPSAGEFWQCRFPGCNAYVTFQRHKTDSKLRHIRRCHREWDSPPLKFDEAGFLRLVDQAAAAAPPPVQIAVAAPTFAELHQAAHELPPLVVPPVPQACANVRAFSFNQQTDQCRWCQSIVRGEAAQQAHSCEAANQADDAGIAGLSRLPPIAADLLPELAEHQRLVNVDRPDGQLGRESHESRTMWEIAGAACRETDSEAGDAWRLPRGIDGYDHLKSNGGLSKLDTATKNREIETIIRRVVGKVEEFRRLTTPAPAPPPSPRITGSPRLASDLNPPRFAPPPRPGPPPVISRAELQSDYDEICAILNRNYFVLHAVGLRYISEKMFDPEAEKIIRPYSDQQTEEQRAAVENRRDDTDVKGITIALMKLYWKRHRVPVPSGGKLVSKDIVSLWEDSKIYQVEELGFLPSLKPGFVGHSNAGGETDNCFRYLNTWHGLPYMTWNPRARRPTSLVDLERYPTNPDCRREVFGYKFVSETVGLFVGHLRDVICAGNPAKFAYMLGWMTSNVVKPADPIGVMVYITGLQGVGKSLFCQVFSRLLGQAGKVIYRSNQLTSQFGMTLFKDTTLAVIDELNLNNSTGQERDATKAMLTGVERHEEEKYEKQRQVTNHMSVMASSNDYRFPIEIALRRTMYLVASSCRLSGEDRDWGAKFAERFDQKTEAGERRLKVLTAFFIDYAHTKAFRDWNGQQPPSSTEKVANMIGQLPLIDRWWWAMVVHASGMPAVTNPADLSEENTGWRAFPITTNGLFFDFKTWLGKKQLAGREKLTADRDRTTTDVNEFIQALRKLLPAPFDTRLSMDEFVEWTLPQHADCRTMFIRSMRWPEDIVVE